MAFTDFLCLFGKEGRGRAERTGRGQTNEQAGPLVQKNAVGQCACEKPTGRCIRTGPLAFDQNLCLNQ